MFFWVGIIISLFGQFRRHMHTVARVSLSNFIGAYASLCNLYSVNMPSFKTAGYYN